MSDIGAKARPPAEVNRPDYDGVSVAAGRLYRYDGFLTVMEILKQRVAPDIYKQAVFISSIEQGVLLEVK